MKIEENLKRLIEGTEKGKIVWERKNPTTYNWKTASSDGTHINIILQKYKSKDQPDMLFRLWNLDDRYSLLDLQYKDASEETKRLLQELYEKVSGNDLYIKDIFSDILRDI
ncbi:hypothetical protein [Autumnicola psychrophila]|uniref:Uncharacterized protein n=1 Tax=Autumnicola psychrophila TaxID=3075592 RepID=A0ABU3DUB3_9FLAO|nr:hypothetical protein [Zunongwangia sp. F225]MDT0687301.1 hypothetical protein [Zunongwangia sp. F225]